MKKKKLLFINAHPDDDTIIAGTMITLIKRGYSVMEYVCTDGSQATPLKNESGENIVANRIKETESFNKVIRAETPRIYPTNGKTLSYSDEILFDMVKTLRKFRPDIIVLHNRNDYHFEHRRSHEIGLLAVENAFRNTLPELGERLTAGIILETDGLNVIPNPLVTFDVSAAHREKVKVITQAYGKRLGKEIIAFDGGLSRMRGARIGTAYAESYDLINPEWYKLTKESAKILADFVTAGTRNTT